MHYMYFLYVAGLAFRIIFQFCCWFLLGSASRLEVYCLTFINFIADEIVDLTSSMSNSSDSLCVMG